MKHMSLNEIARAANVSPATVSRVINNKPGIASETRERILAVMRQNNYYPRELAGSDRARPTRMIALVINEPDENIYNNPFFIMAIKGASSLARRRGFHVMVSFSRNGEEQLDYIENIVDSNGADGLVLFSIEEDDSSVKKLRECNFPFAVIGRPDSPDETLWVDNDNFHAVYTTISMLVDRGYKRIAFLATKWSRTFAMDRFAGYQQALRSRGISPITRVPEERGSDPVLEEHLSVEDAGYHMMKRILTEDSPDAVLAEDDFVAFGALQAIREVDKRRIAVVGFNNSLQGRYQTPALSTIDIHPEELGQGAAELLINRLEQRSDSVTHRIIPTTFIARDTAGRARRSAPVEPGG